MRSIIFVFILAMGNPNVFATPISSITVKERLEIGSYTIATEMYYLELFSDIIAQEKISYKGACTKYGSIIESENISASYTILNVDDGSLPPTAMPGFWWGSCLSWIGIIIVYLLMDEGEGRKDQVRSALYGCIVGTLTYGILVIAYNFLAFYVFGT